MRRTTTAAVLLAAGLALTGCGSNHTDTKQAAKPKHTETVSKATLYLVDAHEIQFNGRPSDSDLLAFPPQWCKALDAGHTVAWMLGDGNLYPVGDNWGTAMPDAYTLVVSGTKEFCPRNLPAVKEELRASGNY